ncbi:MAG: hypothetical protein ACMUIP_14815 [bacterium]
MPYTVDGVGTMYYGKKNVLSHQGVCEYCGKQVTLTSYDTRLFFVLIYIPVLPLGQKRVINDCSSCRKHRVMPLNEYTHVTQNSVDEALSRYHSEPDNKQLALDALDTLFSLNKYDEANTVMQSIEKNFPHDAELLFKFAAWLEYSGEKIRSDEYFQKAFNADRNYKPARRAMGVIKIEEGNFQEAESLVHDLINPEGDFDPSVVYILARKYKETNDPQKALHYYKQLIMNEPSCAQDRTIRNEIKECEKDMKVIETILPRAQFRCWSPWVKGAMTALFAFIIVYSINILIFMNATVWVANGYKENLRLSVDGKEEIIIPPGSIRKLKVGEGIHEYAFKGIYQGSMKDELRYGLIDRFFSKPVHIINPGGMKIFLLEHTEYVPEGWIIPPNYSYDIIWGMPIIKYNDIDYRFKEFPDTITLDSHSSGVQKTRFSEMKSDPVEILQILEQDETFKDKDALRFLELCLTQDPKNSTLAGIYLSYVEYSEEFQRAKDYLHKYLALEPLAVDLHRVYQTLSQSTAQEMSALRSQYDAFLRKNMKKPNYYYLRARIENYGKDIFPFVAQGLSEDPHNISLLNLSTHAHLFQGEFPKAQETINKADSASIKNNPLLETTSWYVTLATKEWQNALTRIKEERKQSIFDYSLLLKELTLLYNMGNSHEAKKVIEDWKAKQVKRAEQEGWAPDNYLEMLDLDIAFLTNDFSLIEHMSIIDEKSTDFQPYVAFCYYLGKNQLQNAEKLFIADTSLNKSPYTSLELFLAYALQEKIKKGLPYFEKATTLLAQSRRACQRELADIIKNKDRKRLRDLVTDDFEIKALVAAALGIMEKNNVRQKEYYTLARLFNIVRNFKFHLINRVCTS